MKTFALTLLLLTPLLFSTGIAAEKKILLIAGTPSHGPLAHEHNAGVLLLKKCLDGVPGVNAVAHLNGWPKEASAFDGADAVLIYCDGGAKHMAIQENRLAELDKLMKRGVGLGCLHYGVEVPAGEPGQAFQNWIGGHYETHFSCNPMWKPDFTSFPSHPITRGVKPFSIHDEWYFNMRFRPDMKGITPILVAKPSDAVREGTYVHPKGPYPHIIGNKGRDEIMMWAVEREDGGRGFGFTGGHFHLNWGNENFRKTVLNALLWMAKAEVPKEGVQSTITEDDLMQNLDPKRGSTPPVRPAAP